MGNKIFIRNADPGDVPEILELIRELARFEQAADQVELSAEELRADGFGPNPSFCCFVATVENKVIGMALYFYKYSTWKGKTLYLDDIVVKEDYRRQGVGQLLFDKVIQVAAEKKLRRMEWQVLEWNEPAIEFYKKNKAKFDPEWINCKLTDKDYC